MSAKSESEMAAAEKSTRKFQLRNEMTGNVYNEVKKLHKILNSILKCYELKKMFKIKL